MADDKPTPAENAQRINGVVDAIHELQQSGEKSSRNNRYFLMAVMGIITTAAGFWGNEVLIRLRAVESIQNIQAVSMAKIETKIDLQEDLKTKLSEVESRLRAVEQGARKP